MFADMRKRIETTAPELNDRIAVSIDRAADILDLGRSSIYELLGKGQLKSAHFGRSRRVTMESIRQLVAAAEHKSA